MMAAEQPSLRTCFRCEAVFHQEIHLLYHQIIYLFQKESIIKGSMESNLHQQRWA